MSTEQLHEQINAITTPQQAYAVMLHIQDYKEQVNADQAQYQALHRAWFDHLHEQGISAAPMGELLTERTNALIAEVTDVLLLNGVAYPLTEWITYKTYSEQHEVTIHTLMGWISRGIVPADHVKEIPQLGIKLIKNVPYSPRTYVRQSGIDDTMPTAE